MESRKQLPEGWQGGPTARLSIITHGLSRGAVSIAMLQNRSLNRRRMNGNGVTLNSGSGTVS
jgi:hypothetical protein